MILRGVSPATFGTERSKANAFPAAKLIAKIIYPKAAKCFAKAINETTDLLRAYTEAKDLEEIGITMIDTMGQSANIG